MKAPLWNQTSFCCFSWMLFTVCNGTAFMSKQNTRVILIHSPDMSLKATVSLNLLILNTKCDHWWMESSFMLNQDCFCNTYFHSWSEEEWCAKSFWFHKKQGKIELDTKKLNTTLIENYLHMFCYLWCLNEWVTESLAHSIH